MVAIEIVVGRPRRWQTLIIERLRRAGHTISIVATRGDSWSPAIEALLRPETMVFLRGGDALSSPVSLDFPQQPTIGPADLRLDLAGTAASSPVPTLRLLFDGNAAPAAAIATLARGELPELAVSLDGRAIVATASPMVDRPYSVVRSLEDVLARAVTLMISSVPAPVIFTEP